MVNITLLGQDIDIAQKRSNPNTDPGGTQDKSEHGLLSLYYH